VNGEALATGQGCAGCHISTATGPAWLPAEGSPGIGARAATRILQDDYTGAATTAEQYLVESIVQTNLYVVPGYQANIMPAAYGDTLTAQDMADLVAYLLTLK